MSSPRVISFHYTLTNDAGAVLDSSQGSAPLAYLEGAGNIIPSLEKELKSLPQGEKKKVKIPARDAYGEKKEELIVQVSKSQFPPDVQLKVGDRFRAGEGHHSPVYQVMAIGEQITLDGNHPLAGQDLHFDVEIITIRNASEEEVAHGHVHGAHGHHH